eukprot:422515_1
MDLYQIQIRKSRIKTKLDEFIERFHLDQLWKFLIAFRNFLENVCKTVEKNAHIRPLVMYLENVADIQTNLVQYFPNKIRLNQAAKAYEYCAHKYQEKCDGQNVKKDMKKEAMEKTT